MTMTRMIVATLSAAMLLVQPVWAQSTLAVDAASADPVRLEISRKVAAQLVPDGVFMKVMSGSMDQFMGPMMDSVMDMPLKELIEKFVKDPDDVKDMNDFTINEVMAIIDPAFKERTQVGMKAMMSEMGTIMSSMEPAMREGMAVAYSNRFSATELADMQRFFSSPSGSRFASENMTIMTDPALVKQMQAIMPKVLEAMPAMVKKMTEATEKFPPAKTAETLTKADREALAKLIGIKASDLK
jgi:hypothetical protein